MKVKEYTPKTGLDKNVDFLNSVRDYYFEDIFGSYFKAGYEVSLVHTNSCTVALSNLTKRSLKLHKNQFFPKQSIHIIGDSLGKIKETKSLLEKKTGWKLEEVKK
mgnify:CR=1 FL=1